MGVFHVTLMIWAVPWVAPDTVLHTSTPASSESGTGQLHFVESHIDSAEEESSDSDDFVVVTDSEKSSDSEDFVIVPLDNESYAEVDENTDAKQRDLQHQPTNRTVDPLAKPCLDVDNSGCIPEKQNGQDESAVDTCPSTVAAEEAIDAVNTAANRDFSEKSCPLDKIEKNYIWAHAGISDSGDRNNLFYSQSGKTPVCLIQATHECDIVRLRASCLATYEKWTSVKEIQMHTIMEEAADVWAKPSAKIIEFIEQFKNESAFYTEEMKYWYQKYSLFERNLFQSRQILKLATIYSEMHPESTYTHVHTHRPFSNFNVHT